MENNYQKHPFRLCCLITAPKLAEKAITLFHDEQIPLQVQILAQGTASNEIMNLLGLGTIDKSILISFLPKQKAFDLIKKMNRVLKLKSKNSGIAFTAPITGANNILPLLYKKDLTQTEEPQRKETHAMSEYKYELIAALVNQGYSDEVMNAAKSAQATGGTVFHSRRIVHEEAVQKLGLSVQEEREIVLILTDTAKKMEIMKAISQSCGMKSEARGLILSIPIDHVIGLEEFEEEI